MMGALIAGSAAAGSLATSHTPAPVVFAAPAAPASAAIRAEGGYADVVAKAAPAVVTVRSKRVVKTAEESPFGGQDPFEEFFGLRRPARGRSRSSRGVKARSAPASWSARTATS